MSFFSWLRTQILPRHHRFDPRLHEHSMPSTHPDDGEWDSRSNEQRLSASERQWIDGIVTQASLFPLECFIRFEYRPEQQIITCRREEWIRQPGLDLGLIERIEPKRWRHIWQFLYDHFNSSLKLTPLEGEVERAFVIWTSPRHVWDTYALTPNAISVKLCVSRPSSSKYKTPWCGLDGPCTAH